MAEFHSETGLRHNGRIAMIAGGSLARDAELARLATLAGCTPLMMDQLQAADFLLVDFCSKTEGNALNFTEINHYLATHNSIALIWSTLESVEEIYATLPLGQYHILVNAHDVEAMPILAGAFERSGMDRLQETDHEVDFESLHRISDELAEFARTLARMAQLEKIANVADKPLSFRPPPLGGFQSFPVSDSVPHNAPAAVLLREIIKQRRLRESFFPPDLFADPAWDILLDLKAAEQEGQHVSVSSLCIAAAVPPTTALRWITAMTQSGMLERRQDPTDARRVFIGLSAETSAKLDDCFVALGARSAPIV
ncbi:MAG: hypothetical protein B7Y44_07585 [Sphingomonadales bacterium 28-55-16]|nr:MAG: hypothetical protein B7Y44_07585 [Sphingomonadales bacterium 28-55-16]